MCIGSVASTIYDPKHCAAPTEPVIHNGNLRTETNGMEISDSD